MLAIYGSGGFGRELVAPARAALLRAGRNLAELAFIDDNRPAGDDPHFSAAVPVLRLEDLRDGDEYIVAVGDGRLRAMLAAKCDRIGLKPFSLFAEDYIEGGEVEIGEGAVFAARTMVTASAKIGRQFQCNIYSYVAHDCVIGDFVTFAPSVCCNGNVHVQDYAYVGTGAVLKQGTADKPLVIGAGAIVGMGAVVTKDVEPGAVVVGNPAMPR
ncbi:acetyltransferase [Sphingopyxis bauzanensis]|uniref:Acetyltransferase n=1 Tax=Sphingopyxis bauzanensis TaxID=651663 RepID=A0A246JNB1_9SPHN|nr:acetyltransferase [Sphingopyxis bauzanensis]OWQ94138.1 acetyltransferase [Sphingopyxis bauzanensis]